MDPRYAPVRVGDTVRHAAGSSPVAVRDLLLHLESIGFDGAPRYLGTDDQGREVLSWIDGDVPLPPYPAWAMTDRALGDLGGLVRRLHEATATFRGTASDWSTDWADPDGGSVICHNDLFPENVVFRDGRVVALIDLAMSAPGRPLWDVAIAAETWGPLGDPGRRDQHPMDLDGIARLGVLARAYGLEPERAEELVDIMVEERGPLDREHPGRDRRPKRVVDPQLGGCGWRRTSRGRRCLDGTSPSGADPVGPRLTARMALGADPPGGRVVPGPVHR